LIDSLNAAVFISTTPDLGASQSTDERKHLLDPLGVCHNAG
jgi:hypothetical protein